MGLIKCDVLVCGIVDTVGVISPPSEEEWTGPLTNVEVDVSVSMSSCSQSAWSVRQTVPELSHLGRYWCRWRIDELLELLLHKTGVLSYRCVVIQVC
jgi:hypothetical protein